MKKIIKSFVVLFILIVILTLLFRIGFLNKSIHETAWNIIVPVVDALGYPSRIISKTKLYFLKKEQLISSNKKLRNRIQELERINNAQTEIESNYKNFEELSEIKNQYNYDILPARIVLKDNSLWSKTIVINKGKKDGIVLNMAVVSGAGLVGKIIQTGYAYSRVLLVIDKTFKVGAKLKETRCIGLVEGNGVNELILNFLPKNAKVEMGNEIITSGLGGIFPPGYLIGTAKEQFFQEHEFYQYSTIQPSVDFNKLELVAVVKRPPLQIDVRTDIQTTKFK